MTYLFQMNFIGSLGTFSSSLPTSTPSTSKIDTPSSHEIV